MTADDLIQKLKDMPIGEFLEQAITLPATNELLTQVKSQMRAGERGDGTSFKKQKIANTIPEGYGYFNDLFETGEFSDSLRLDKSLDEIVGSDWKEPYIRKALGDSVFDPNANRIDFETGAKPIIAEKLKEQIINYLNS